MDKDTLDYLESLKEVIEHPKMPTMADEEIWLNMVQTILSNKEGYYHGLDPYVAADMALTAFKLRFREG